MKNSQKGSVTTVLLIIIIILLVIIGGMYAYENQKSIMPALVSNVPQPVAQRSAQGQQTAAQAGDLIANNPVVEPSMMGEKTYVDPEVGFTFYYPGDWQVTRTAPSPDSDSNITQGTVLATLVIGNKDVSGNTVPQISIQEVHSPAYSITDSSGTGMNPTYFFDFSTHTWMTTAHRYDISPNTIATSIADVSNNTMGGLHMLGGIVQGQYVTATIIPLSAQDFLVVNKLGSYDAMLLAKTIMATDPAVATPVDSDQQSLVVQAEAVAYAAPQPGVTWKNYTDPQLGISFKYPATFGSASAELNGMPQVIVSPTGSNIDPSNGCYTQIGPEGYHGGSQVLLNGMSFCYSSVGDPGAGQLYTTSDYTTHINGEYVTLSYVVHTSNGCGVFQGDPNYISCEYTANNFNTLVTQPIQQSVGSLTFNK